MKKYFLNLFKVLLCAMVIFIFLMGIGSIFMIVWAKSQFELYLGWGSLILAILLIPLMPEIDKFIHDK